MKPCQLAGRHLWHRLSFLILGLLLVSMAVFGQTASSDSQTLQALLHEVRQLRQYLQTTTVAAQKTQILLYRAQAQEAAVGRAQQRLDDAHSKLAGAHADRKKLEAEIKTYEDIQNRSQNPAERKEVEDVLPKLKAKLAIFWDEEQQRQTAKIEAEQQLRTEQAKLGGLQDELDRLEKTLENLSRQ